MASSTGTLSSGYHAPLAIISVFAIAGTAFYLYINSSVSSPRPLRRSNATRRPIRTSFNASVTGQRDNSTLEGNVTSNVPSNHNQTESDAVADAEYDGDGNETEVDLSLEPPTAAPLGLKELVYYIASDNAEQITVVHRGCICSGCDASPIRGIRYKCLNCVDFDLCPACESLDRHNRTHMLVQIKIPAPFIGAWEPQKVAYPMPEPSNHELGDQKMSELRAKYNLDKPKLKMLYQNFKAYAPISQPDGDQVHWGIDRETFGNICFNPLQENSTLRNNLLIDRIFHVWSNRHGLIGFDEFLAKLSISGNPNSESEKVETVFKAVDMDGDGLVTKDDFLRIFEAHYEIQTYLARVHMDLEAFKRKQTIQETELHKPLKSQWQELVSNEDYFGRGSNFNSSIPIEAFDPSRPDDIDQSHRGPVMLDMLPWSIAINDRSTGTASGNEGLPEPTRGPSATDMPNRQVFPEQLSMDNSSAPAVSFNGFDLPATHIDSTKEALSQIVRQGFWELIDDYFKEIDYRAVPILQSQQKREMWRAEIQAARAMLQATEAVDTADPVHPEPEANQNQTPYNPYETSFEWLSQDSTLPQHRPNDPSQLKSQLQALCFWDDEEKKLTKRSSDGSLVVCLSLNDFKDVMNLKNEKPTFLWSWFNISSF